MLQFSADDLAQLAKNTREMLAAGLHIPLWPRHAEAGSDEGGPQFSEEDARENVGWMVDVKQLPNGDLEQVLEVTDEEAIRDIESGSVKFTSPEIAHHIDGLGRDFGTVIRHMALTATPRNPQQEALRVDTNSRMPALQFSLSDKIEAPTMATVIKPSKAKQFNEDDTKEDDEFAPPADTVVGDDVVDPASDDNPDMPKSDNKKLEAVVAHLSEMGIELPSDWENNDAGMDVLLAAIKTKNAAKDAAQEDEEVSDTAPDPNELIEDRPPVGAQFSEADKHLRKENRELKARIDRREREDLTRRINSANIPPSTKKKLAARVNAVQFSEDGNPRPQFSVTDVIELFSGALPRGMQFSEDGLVTDAHPNGDAHFEGDRKEPKTLAEAREINEGARKAALRA